MLVRFQKPFFTSNPSVKKFGFIVILMASLFIATITSGCDSSGKENTASSQGSDSSLPESYPKEIPVYQPSQFERILALGGRRYIFNTTEDISEVKAFYEQAFAQQGWSIERVYDDGAGMERLTVRYKEDETFILALIAADSGAGGSFYIHL